MLDRVLDEVPVDKVARRQETTTSARSARNKVEEPLDKVHGQVSLDRIALLHADGRDGVALPQTWLTSDARSQARPRRGELSGRARNC